MTSATATTAGCPVDTVLLDATTRSSSIHKRDEARDAIATAGTQIRSRLLYRLGIPDESCTTCDYMTTGKEATEHLQTNTSRPPPQSFFVPLKESNGRGDKESLSTHRQSHNHHPESSSIARVVAFHNDVSVLPIPMRTEYSDRIARRLWCNRDELQYNAERNLREFQAEGWNWRTVMEESDMIVGLTGELIHPVHCPKHSLLWQRQSKSSQPFNPFEQRSSSSSWKQLPTHHYQQKQQHYVPPPPPSVQATTTAASEHSSHLFFS